MVHAFAAAVLLVVASSVNGQGDPAQYGPVFWCDDSDLAKLVGVDKQCDAYSKAVYNKKVTLTLLYESLCPGCRDVSTNLFPKLYPTWKDYVNFEFVPYGNAKRTGSGFNCQHGTLECQLNQVETCGIHYIDDLDVRFNFIVCIEGLDESIQPADVVTTCAPKAGVTAAQQQSIASCWNSQEGTNLEKAMADRTDNIFPQKHKWVPWVLFNNASLGVNQGLVNDQTLLEYQLCALYRGDNVPKPCASLEALPSRAERTVAQKAPRNCRK